jgi:DNA-binding NtrC family response regulator
MQPEQSSAPPVVLIVESDVLLRLVTANNLRDAGFDVVEAVNCSEAFRLLDNIPVDVLFSALDTPGTADGLALAQWVHRSRADTRIVLTSSTAGALGGAEEYAFFLPKPYANNDVEHLLRSVLPELPSTAVHLP